MALITKYFLVTVFSISLITFFSSAYSGEIGASGNFHGLSGHTTKGTASIAQGPEGPVVKLGKDFKFDGAPDAKVGFGKGGQYDIQSQLAPLKSDNGEQQYGIPSTVDIGQYDEIYIWCEAYNVPLGVAKIQ